MTPREQEIDRIKSVLDPGLSSNTVLHAILNGLKKNEMSVFWHGEPVPELSPTNVEAVKSLYRLAATEPTLRRHTSQHICQVAQDYLKHVMPPIEFERFVASVPARFPLVSDSPGLFEELEAEETIYDTLNKLGVVKLPRVPDAIRDAVAQMISERRTLMAADVEAFRKMSKE